MLYADRETLKKVEEQLRENCPSPESELNKLCRIAGYLPDSEDTAKTKRIVLDINDLTAQTRWNLGQAILLMELYPQILLFDDDSDKELGDSRIGKVFPTTSLLLMRQFVRHADRVLYYDWTSERVGGTVAGWVFHMLVDNSIYRTIAALDRIAHLLWFAAKSKHENVHFRKNKLERIHETLNCSESRELLKIAEHPFFRFLLNYRNGFTHDLKEYSVIAGILPGDMWDDPNGARVRWEGHHWDANDLFGLGNAAYHQLIDALEQVVPICERKWPPPDEH